MKYIFSLLFLVVLFASCEDIVPIDTGDTLSQIVVEGWLDDQSQTQIIKLTKSIDYFEPAFTPGIEDAVVIVTSSDGSTYEFLHETNGSYQWKPATGQVIGQVGDVFELHIEAEGKTLSSSSKMNRVPPIDSIGQELRMNGFEEGIYCQFYARDPAGLHDTYWIKTYKNDEYLSLPFELNLAYDAGFDSGGEVDNLIFIPPVRETINPTIDSIGQSPWMSGDKIRVEIHSINNDAFAFMESVRDQLLNSFNTIFAEPLANSPGNIINETDDEEILGIFNVGAISIAEDIID